MNTQAARRAMHAEPDDAWTLEGSLYEYRWNDRDACFQRRMIPGKAWQTCAQQPSSSWSSSWHRVEREPPEPEFDVYEIVSDISTGSIGPTKCGWGINVHGCWFYLDEILRWRPDGWGFDVPDGATPWLTEPTLLYNPERDTWSDTRVFRAGDKVIHAMRVRFRREG